MITVQTWQSSMNVVGVDCLTCGKMPEGESELFQPTLIDGSAIDRAIRAATIHQDTYKDHQIVFSVAHAAEKLNGMLTSIEDRLPRA